MQCTYPTLLPGVRAVEVGLFLRENVEKFLRDGLIYLSYFIRGKNPTAFEETGNRE